MSDMKCPFCQQELKELYINGNPVGFRCKNKNCPETNIMCGTKGLWQELIRTRKALDVAVDALKELKPQKAKGGGYWAVKSADAIKLINTTIEQITALEQKDVK